MSEPDIDVCLDVLLHGGGFVLPSRDLSYDAAAFVGRLISSAQGVKMRIAVHEDGQFLTVTNPDHQVTEIEKRAGRMFTESVLGGHPVLTYEQALQASRRLAIRPVR
ncbi:hypothetical protein IV500_09520 [Paeniglutamicibacter antarcticus]|uniref:Uncharacterized protein n=1 Tax=Arthrobacter terrae TaxID=2935737 RepID=A0A931CJT5_9MICC|nr:hypothetical protein [Arthrobacter terrae]MBG0739623.1 hypothetical protein [Arthrobacter terrae]